MYPFDFHFQRKNNYIDFNKIFVAMPFEEKFEPIFTDIIEPAKNQYNKENGMELFIYRGKDPKHTRSGWLEILENLYSARIVLGVLTENNANVFYELGIAHATQQIHRQLLIADKDYDPKFDLKDLIYVKYDFDNVDKSIKDLSDAIFDTIRGYDSNQDREVSMAISRLTLPELSLLYKYGDSSHFSMIQNIEGLPDLCKDGLLRLSHKPEGQNRYSYSYYWTNLGNSVLVKFVKITLEEKVKRINEYNSQFKE